MSDREKELEAFRKGLEEHVFPVAKEAGLSHEKIAEELYALVAPTFTITFNCAGGHLYSYCVTISPTYKPLWNAEDELGLAWLAEYLGKEISQDSRFDNLHVFVEHLASLAKQLPHYIEILRTADSSFWEDIQRFVQKEISKRPWWNYIQKSNGSAKR